MQCVNYAILIFYCVTFRIRAKLSLTGNSLREFNQINTGLDLCPDPLFRYMKYKNIYLVIIILLIAGLSALT